MNYLTTLENMFAAVAFAEVGIRETALEIAGLTPSETSVVTWLENNYAAVAFAEANLDEEALQIAGLPARTGAGLSDLAAFRGLEDAFAAVAYAEAGDDGTALEIVGRQRPEPRLADFLNDVGLVGAPFRFGYVAV